jgi:hypothetical protein
MPAPSHFLADFIPIRPPHDDVIPPSDPLNKVSVAKFRKDCMGLFLRHTKFVSDCAGISVPNPVFVGVVPNECKNAFFTEIFRFHHGPFCNGQGFQSRPHK